MPAEILPYKLWFAAGGVLILAILNMRGVKESIAVISPVFLVFVVTHIFLIICAFGQNIGNFGATALQTSADIKNTASALGVGGMLILILRAYSMGAGTFTGIEAVSNGMNVFMEPKVKNLLQAITRLAGELAGAERQCGSD